MRVSAPAGVALLIGLAIGACGTGDEDRSAAQPPSAGTDTAQPAAPQLAVHWTARSLDPVPAPFRPGGWSAEDTLWGMVRGRITSIAIGTGEVRTLPIGAWSVDAAGGVVSWTNEEGAWALRDGGEPTLLAGPEPDPESGFDGPPRVLWSPDGTRALLGWWGEWDARWKLLAEDGSLRALETRLPGYYLNSAALWLDSTRVLFETVATGPLVGEPGYRESGWRGDLALLDLARGEYRRVTSVPDHTYLRVAGRWLDELLVTEWDAAGVRAQWLYDPVSWERRPAPVPNGRAFAARGGAVVVLLDPQADITDAVLVAGGDTLALGRVARDAEPVFSPSGRRGALRTEAGVLLLESAPR